MMTSLTPRLPRILVIDDEPLLGRTIRRSLGVHYDVVITDAGADAIEILLADGDFDCILCDLQMPDVSGMDVYAWAAEHAPALAPRFVFMTGGTFTERARLFLTQRATRQLDKPFDAETLRQRIAEICGSRVATTVIVPADAPSTSAQS